MHLRCPAYCLSCWFIFFPFFFFFFIMTEKYICPKRSSVIYCEVICYHVVKCESSASCKLHFPELYKCLSVSILYHRCLFHTYLHVSLCLFIGKKWKHIGKMSLFNVHVYFWFCLQFIVTDQRDLKVLWYGAAGES